MPAVAAKVAAVPAAGTGTEAGTATTAALLLLRLTAVPPAGAGWFNVTVQVEEAPGATVVGLQANELISTGDTRLMLAVAVLPL